MKKSVLIIGASGNLGSGIAKYLAGKDYEIVVHYNNSKDQAAKLVEYLDSENTPARLLKLDITNPEQCQHILTSDVEHHGAYYGVVLSSGIIRDAAFPAMTAQEWSSVIQTNLFSFYNVLNPIIMPMIRRKSPGRIIALASASGVIGNRGQVNYSASKGGIISACKALALELAKRNITVNCVAPGAIESDMINQSEIGHIKDFIPMRRLGQISEVASLVSYLLSEDASYITRQVISVNGGLH